MADRVELIARFVAAPGRGDALEAALREVVAATRPEPGCLDIQLWASGDGRFFTRSSWRDAEALEAHRELAHVVRFQAALPDLVGEPGEIVPIEALDA